jgi:hypothetical protein
MIPDAGIFQKEQHASIINYPRKSDEWYILIKTPNGNATNNYPDTYFIVNNRL